jgi:hypothetical protein
MDPDVVWKVLREDLAALKNNPDDLTARKRAIDSLIIMARWLRIGGFPPTVDYPARHG